MSNKITDWMDAAYKRLSPLTRRTLVVAYEISVTFFLVIFGATLFYEYQAKQLAFWVQLAITLLLCAMIVGRNCAYRQLISAQRQQNEVLEGYRLTVEKTLSNLLMRIQHEIVLERQKEKAPRDISTMN
jgi:membrane protein implicated in regulation of membrane protease activity